jgi:hypothetical protein
MTERRPDLDERGQDDSSRTELDVYDKALRSPGVDGFLQSENLGLGYYEDAERWQQIESYRFGLFGDRVFSEPLIDRAIDETKRQLALKGKQFYDREDKAAKSLTGWTELSEEQQQKLKEEERIDKRRYLKQHGEEIWKQMSDRQRKEAIEIATGMDRKWTPPQWRMLMARHETSRSRGARLLDNVFGREKVKRVFENRKSDSGGGGLLSSGGGDGRR